VSAKNIGIRFMGYNVVLLTGNASPVGAVVV